jgi:hypothetical protein
MLVNPKARRPFIRINVFCAPRARRLIVAVPLPPLESFSVKALPTKDGN